jgi:hypothetical protein
VYLLILQARNAAHVQRVRFIDGQTRLRLIVKGLTLTRQRSGNPGKSKREQPFM